MTEWNPIETAPRDGTVIRYRRVYQGKVTYEGKAVWRTVRFPACYDPISGECFAKEADETGWMCPDVEKRVPEPTHWLPADTVVAA